MMEKIYCEVWAQFQPGKDGKWIMRAYVDRPDWELPNAKYFLVKIPVPHEVLGTEDVIASFKEAGADAGSDGGMKAVLRVGMGNGR